MHLTIAGEQGNRVGVCKWNKLTATQEENLLTDSDAGAGRKIRLFKHLTYLINFTVINSNILTINEVPLESKCYKFNFDQEPLSP